MRKIVVYELLSLDGVAEDPDDFIADWDDAMDANLAAVIATQDAVILGRRSYTEWAQFWPSSQIQPFATFINGVTKYVATSTPLDRDWANATVLDGGLVEFVRDLKQQRGGDVGVHASISVAQALLAANVVDELRLVIAPRIAGRGRRLLDGLPSIQLESMASGSHRLAICSSTIALFVSARAGWLSMARAISAYRCKLTDRGSARPVSGRCHARGRRAAGRGQLRSGTR